MISSSSLLRALTKMIGVWLVARRVRQSSKPLAPGRLTSRSSSRASWLTSQASASSALPSPWPVTPKAARYSRVLLTSSASSSIISTSVDMRQA